MVKNKKNALSVSNSTRLAAAVSDFMNLNELLPKNKSDLDSIEKIKENYSIFEIDSIVPELLTWLQDSNWPVGVSVSAYLRQYVNIISHHIVKILEGNDDIWSYWCIQMLIMDSSEQRISHEILVALEKILLRSRFDDLDGELKLIAQEAINKIRLSQ